MFEELSYSQIKQLIKLVGDQVIFLRYVQKLLSSKARVKNITTLSTDVKTATVTTLTNNMNTLTIPVSSVALVSFYKYYYKQILCLCRYNTSMKIAV